MLTVLLFYHSPELLSGWSQDSNVSSVLARVTSSGSYNNHRSYSHHHSRSRSRSEALIQVCRPRSREAWVTLWHQWWPQLSPGLMGMMSLASDDQRERQRLETEPRRMELSILCPLDTTRPHWLLPALHWSPQPEVESPQPTPAHPAPALEADTAVMGWDNTQPRQHNNNAGFLSIFLHLTLRGFKGRGQSTGGQTGGRRGEVSTQHSLKVAPHSESLGASAWLRPRPAEISWPETQTLRQHATKSRVPIIWHFTRKSKNVPIDFKSVQIPFHQFY